MLTLILLVVLGGGAGLMAVWLVDARGLAGLVDRSGWRSLRRTPGQDTTRATAAESVTAPGPERVAAPSAGATATALAPTTTTRTAYVPVEAPLEPLPRQSLRRDAMRVPASYTAVEGAYRDVAQVPRWRQLVSLVTLLVVLLLVGAAVAALAGVTIGLLAELVDGAIG